MNGRMDVVTERAAIAALEAALDRPSDVREAFLLSQPNLSEAARERARALLAAETQGWAGSGLQTGGARLIDEDDSDDPDSVGAYRVIRLIGRGGMGNVYLAERANGDFDRVVAIKVIKQRLITDRMIARFRHERQILADLDHPNIARLFDGGETQGGAPFFVMEFIEGRPLDQWLAGARRSVSVRLEVFRQVCDAVEAAHRRLVIHRDLTPSNILVTADDTAKLIDFGIAQPDSDPDRWAGTAAGTDTGRDRTDLAAEKPAYTPGFAAPEQRRGGPADTLLDVHALGKLLAILVGEDADEELAAIARRAAAENPGDRYPTVRGLSIEIERYLTGFPVEAMGSGRSYVLRKFVARNRIAVLAAGLALAALLAALTMTIAAYSRAEAAREREQQRFEETRGIAKFMLYDLYDTLDATPGNTASLARIADEARDYLERLGRVANPSSDLRLEIAQGYHRLSSVSGNPERPNLGRREDARLLIDRAIADLELLHTQYPERGDYARALAAAHYSDAILRFIGEDDNAGALRSGDRSAALYTALAKAEGLDADRFNATRSQLQAAKALVWLDRGTEGVERLTRLRREVEAETVRRPNDREVLRLLAAVNSELNNTSAWHYDTSDPGYAAGLEAADRAVAIYRGLIESSAESARRDLENGLVAALYQRAQARGDAGGWQGSLADVEEAIAIVDRFIRSDRGDDDAVQRRETLQSQQVYALLEVGRTEEAIAVSRKLTRDRVRRSASHPDNPGYARNAAGALSGLAEALEVAGQKEEACQVHRQALDRWKAVDRRWSMSPLDRKGVMDDALKALERCRNLPSTRESVSNGSIRTS